MDINLYDEFMKHIDLDNPKFKERTEVHDWRNYVPDEWAKNWHSLTKRERQIIAVMAEMQAEQEEWD